MPSERIAEELVLRRDLGDDGARRHGCHSGRDARGCRQIAPAALPHLIGVPLDILLDHSSRRLLAKQVFEKPLRLRQADVLVQPVELAGEDL
jgi:hypothetical protein